MAIDRNDPEILALIQEVTEPLNRDLRKLKAAKAKGTEIDPEDYARLQEEVSTLNEKLNASGKLSKAETDKLMKALAEKDTALSTYLIDAGLSTELSTAGVAKQFIKPLMSMFKSDAKVKAEDGKYSAVIGEKDLKTAVSEFLGSDEGKHFIAAQQSSGGGAGGGGARTGNAKKFGDMTGAERVALFKKDPVAYQAAKSAV